VGHRIKICICPALGYSETQAGNFTHRELLRNKNRAGPRFWDFGRRASAFWTKLPVTFVIFRESRPTEYACILGSWLPMAIQVILPLTGQVRERRWPRYEIDVPVQLVTEEPTNVVILQGRGTALNRGGMAVSSGVELTIGAQVAVEFTPPCSETLVRVRCFVRNRQRNTYGVEFIAENDSDYESVGHIESTLEKIAGTGSAKS